MIIFSKKRPTGETTRLVDAAIQHLFKTGALKLFAQDDMKNLAKAGRDFNKHQLDVARRFIDPEAQKGNRAQEHFVNIFMMRLSNEHAGTYEHTPPLNFKVIKSSDKEQEDQ